ncbi:hypothetical protein K491DRAFT_291679 [Lophiostoma macrostomum CBS 122681]|uniref:JmjC domain-containing protein n=1 Tax=Lophiostoma macrostomum CBS 122681 TaxID=1314788 RepID=A0A6A6SMZ6_9PLEO|nr:hypothetical protein K491DRAFT_291679 [Lophiostoma macrostomum CBS 122681]
MDSVATSAKVQAFRELLRSIDNDGDKFRACAAMRDDLLEKQTELEWLFASIEEVMVVECARYTEAKQQWSNSRNPDADVKRWERFVGIADSGAGLKKECLAPLTKASGLWGNEKVIYYQWASRGWKYCKLLGTAASRNPKWEEAVVKLNQLLLRRITNGRPPEVSAHPLAQIDLEHLTQWQGEIAFKKEGCDGFTLELQPITSSDLPTGYALDRYGLIVSEKIIDRPEPAEQTATQWAMVQCESPAVTPGASLAATENAPINTSLSPSTRSALSTPLSSVPSTRSQSPADASDMPQMLLAPISMPDSPNLPNSQDMAKVPVRKSKRLSLVPNHSYAAPSSRGEIVKSSTRISSRPSKQGQPSGLNSKYICTCPDTIPSKLLSVIEYEQAMTAKDIETAVKYGAQRDSLCLGHLKKYATWATAGLVYNQNSNDIMLTTNPKRPIIGPEHILPSTNSKRRRLSLPEALSSFEQVIGNPQSLDNLGDSVIQIPKESKDVRPVHDKSGDALFREQVLAQLEQRITRSGPPKRWGELNDQVMSTLLRRASQPTVEGNEDEKEAYFLTGEEAERRLEPHIELHGPIVTINQQQFKWDRDKGQPIHQLFRRMGNPYRSVSVQSPSLSLQNPSCVTMELGSVQQAFKEDKTSKDRLNVLELRNPLPRSVLPYFLTGEDSQLLSRVRDAVLEGATAERCTAPIGEWNKWKDDEDWVLLAQGGAQTLTHQDSCGKATWLTVQQGRVGFGWISRPSEEETRIWGTDPNNFMGGKLRYIVLHPGQTVYFENGMIHFVFRLNEHPTLMLGGHILRWSRINSWIRIVLDQLRFPNRTNEDVQPLAPVYVEAVAQLVSDQKDLGRADELGGEAAIATFFELKREFDEELIKFT